MFMTPSVLVFVLPSGLPSDVSGLVPFSATRLLLIFIRYRLLVGMEEPPRPSNASFTVSLMMDRSFVVFILCSTATSYTRKVTSCCSLERTLSCWSRSWCWCWSCWRISTGIPTFAASTRKCLFSPSWLSRE